MLKILHIKTEKKSEESTAVSMTAESKGGRQTVLQGLAPAV